MTLSALERAARRTAAAQWPWCVPVVVGAFIYETHGAYVARAVAALLAGILVLLAQRRPDRSLLLLFALLPFQGLLLAQLYSWGVPAAVVRPLGSWKEALGLGIVIAGWRGYHAGRDRLDRIDGVALAAIAIVAAYAIVPRLFAPNAPLDSSSRSLAFRASAGFLILFVAARHARLPADFADRAARVVLIVGGIVAAICVYEYFASAAWNRFVIERVHYVRYQVDILHTTPFSFTDIRRYSTISGHRVLRTGSVFLDPTSCGFFLVLPFAVAVERRLRATARGTRAAIFAILLVGAGLVFTQTRAALLGALVVALLAMRPAAGRTVDRRVQFALLLVVGLAIAAPVAAATGLSRRVESTATSADPSSVDHTRSLWSGLDAVEAEPLGHGLATSAGVGQRFDQQAAIGENSYLQVGIETGAISMLVFAALVVLLLDRARRLSRRSSELAIAATLSAGAGLALGGLFLQTWNDFSIAWTFWAFAGAAIGLTERSAIARTVPTAPADGLEVRAR